MEIGDFRIKNSTCENFDYRLNFEKKIVRKILSVCELIKKKNLSECFL